MEAEEQKDDEDVAARRVRARNLLTPITQEVKQALSEVGIEIDVFLMIPASGDAIVTFGTVTDPPDELWIRVEEIVCSIVRKAVGLECVRCREVVCASTAEIPACRKERR